ncbi:MAG TPA: transporter substrate-binding domain-containing protein [Paucimonas sp.]|nr:transporter substrate-binding domain-containing protein [Paucimonas sp.]
MSRLGKLAHWSRLPGALALAGLCAAASASADDAFSRARQRGALAVGLDHVISAYAAGAKFRTPESPDTALAQDLAQRLQVALRAVPAGHAPLPAPDGADVVLAMTDAAAPHGTAIVPTGYAAGPMAIMRTDTDIKHWRQLKGRTVCLSEGGRYAGTIAARYGAREKIFKAPADALLALRTGECDAAVHDSALLEELLKLPEWKKFSATLPAASRTALAFVVPARDIQAAAVLKQVAQQWQATGYLQQLLQKSARSIAFEVYLDQDVPDCH